MNAANLDRKNGDATGIGACACARHGCFVPHTVVDFQKGDVKTHCLLRAAVSLMQNKDKGSEGGRR